MQVIMDATRGGTIIMDDAITLSGFAHSTVYEWLKRGEEDYASGKDTEFSRFVIGCYRSKVELKRELFNIILKAARDDEDWRAAKELLDRIEPKKQEVQLSSDPNAPFEVVFKGMDPQCACDEDGEELPAGQCQRVKVEDGEKDAS
jgi:hypothetical protein